MIVNTTGVLVIMNSVFMEAVPYIAGGIIALMLTILFYIQFRDDLLGDFDDK